MTKKMKWMVCFMVAFIAVACVEDSAKNNLGSMKMPEMSEMPRMPGMPKMPGNGMQGGGLPEMYGLGGTAEGTDDLEDFDVIANTTALEERESIPADDEDYVENSNFHEVVDITYNGSSAYVSKSVKGVDIRIDGAGVTVNSDAEGIEYVLTGTSDNGCFKIYSKKNLKLTLNGLTLSNQEGAPINIQSDKRVFVELAEGTANSLTDGSIYNKVSGEKMKGTIYSGGQLIFSGKGTLNVTGYGKHGIASDNYVRFRPGNVINITAMAGQGIKSKNAILIDGGVLNVNVSGTAAKGLACDGNIEVNGGRTTVITTGNGKYKSNGTDTKASAAIKSDSICVINGGELWLKSTGTGGKGISSDQDITVNGGTIRIITTGARYYYGMAHSSAKGIKSDTNITINGGDIRVKATGGEGSEGIEAKGLLAINDGIVEVSSFDDGINSGSHMYLNGGHVYAYASNNDGLDSNGNMFVKGGNIVAVGTHAPECGIDVNDEEGYSLYINGGTLVATGGRNSYPSAESTQPWITFQASVDNGEYLSVNDDKQMLAYQVTRTFGDGNSFLISSPDLNKETSYAVNTASTLTEGLKWHGLVIGSSMRRSGTSVANIKTLE